MQANKMPRKISQFGGWCHSAPTSLRRIYEGFVIGLAIFLVTLSVCRWGSDAFTAEAQLTLTRKSIDSLWPSDELCETILTDSICTILTRDASPAKAFPAETADARSKVLGAHRVAVQMGADSTPLFLNFTLRCVESRAELAIQSVNQLGTQLMQSTLINHDDRIALTNTNWHMVPAKIASRQSAPLAPSTVFACLFVTLLLTVPILIWKQRTGAVLTSRETESLLKTPVLADIGDSPDHSPRNKIQIVFHRLFSAGEWILITMLLAAFVTALLDKQFARQFIGQPVTALADGLRQLSEITWS